MPSRFAFVGAAVAALWLVAVDGGAAPVSVPPARYEGAAGARASAPAQLLLPRGAPARTISLPRADADKSAARSRSDTPSRSGKPRGKSRRLEVGFPRQVPAADAEMSLAGLPWQSTADGTRAARVTLTDAGAAAIRIGFALDDAPPGLVLRFAGSGERAVTYGPVAAQDVDLVVAAAGIYWSPVLEGEEATIEFAVPAGAVLGNARLRIPTISHLTSTVGSLKAFSLNIGASGECEVDIACLDPALRQQASSATNAVARMLVTSDGSTYLCSGTLLNDARSSLTPYFLTANHCLEEADDPANGRGIAAAAAGTINTYWFFQAATCGSVAVPNYVLLAGGAKLLARSIDFDWALVQLNLAPPNGTTFSAWNSEGTIANGTAIDGIHHPEGDLKKFSVGAVSGYHSYSDGSSYVAVNWTNGVTEPGSSGSGLFTVNATNGHFELRGTLSGGESACDNQTGVDEYTRFDKAFALVKPYLAPAVTDATVPVIEYYRVSQDQYFITADPFEISALDRGVPAGWVRTGYRFLAFADPALAPAGAQPVCRLYAPPPYGDARFYSASPAECATMLAQTDQHWVSESAAAFYVQAPSAISGSCPANTRAVYRFLDTTSAPRRRYTAEINVRDALRDDTDWAADGGKAPNRIVMCAPLVDPQTGPSVATANFQGLWWRSPAGSESGWGINFSHQSDTIFATWFTYDATGKPLWFGAELHRSSAGVYSGNVFTATGPPFYSIPFSPTAHVETVVGTMTVTFSGANDGTLAYTVNGISQTKPITRQVFASPVPTCVWGAQQNLALATNYQDLWWAAPAGSEAGWGINFTHQGDLIFATWYTYGADGQPLWFIALATKGAAGVYSGPVSTVTGPVWSSVPFNPANVVETIVGNVVLTFADGNSATMSYTVNGITQAKQITRQVFAAPGTVCN